MSRRLAGPFNRVEGDLEIELDIEEGRVRAAYVNAPLFRGFEQILQGKAPADAMVLVPRICGICSVAQSAAAAAALASAAGIEPPPNGRLASNLTQAAESIADHLTHFYLFFMPDFALAAYADRPWHAAASARFRALSGSAAAPLLAARTAFMRSMGLLAGKWPHTLSLQPGGSSRALQRSEKIRLHRVLRELREFLERTLYGVELEAFSALADERALFAWADASTGDAAHFVRLAGALDLATLGRSGAVLLSTGAYPAPDGVPLFAPGVIEAGVHAAFEPASIAEDTTHARYRDGIAPPALGQTAPDADKAGAYSWCKAPRLGGRVAETGAMARQVIAGQPLLSALFGRIGSTVLTRVLGRLIELARLVPAMERWCEALAPGEAYFRDYTLPVSADSVGLVEAARGTLGHWLSIRGGRIANYQIIAPTTWNFSPRDRAGVPGAAEQALIGTPTGEQPAPAVFHVVRSFDPCMVCTVH